MEDNDRISAKRERPYSAHHMLLGAARVALEDAEKKEPGWYYSALMAMTMSAIAIEALCNAVGDRVIKNWADFESSSPKAKLRIICEELSIEYDSGKEPWSSIVWLCRIRNDLAHAKPKLLSEDYNWSREEYERKNGIKPESKLEKSITFGNAKRAYEQVSDLKYLLCKKIPAGKSFGLYADMWSGRSSA